MNIYVDSILDSLPVSDVKLMEIKKAQDEDPVCNPSSMQDVCPMNLV